MQIIVVGCGKVGANLASRLIEQEHDVIIVENDAKLMQNATDLDCIKITGVPIDRDILKQAGIETADILCAVTQTDNINIMVAQIATDVFAVPKVLTRVFNPANTDVFAAFGLDTICSTELTVQAFLRKISDEKNELSCRVYDNQIMFTQVSVQEDIIGEEIRELQADSGKLIIGILRSGKLHLATEKVKIAKDDKLILAGLE